jgi:hypothetical protein
VAGITLVLAEAQLAFWIAADQAVAGGQSVSHDSGGGRRQLTLADAGEIRRNIDYWNGWCQRLAPGESGRAGIEAVGVIFE